MNMCIEEKTSQDEHSNTANSCKLPSSGIVSQSSSLVTTTYTEATKKAAGNSIDAIIEGEDQSRRIAGEQILGEANEQLIYQPFKSRENYSHSEWFTKASERVLAWNR